MQELFLHIRGTLINIHVTHIWILIFVPYTKVFIAVTCVAAWLTAQPMWPWRVQPSNQFKTFDMRDSRLPIAVCYCLRTSVSNAQVITHAC